MKLSSVIGDHDLTRLRKTAALLDVDRCLIISRSFQRIDGLNLTPTVDLLLTQPGPVTPVRFRVLICRSMRAETVSGHLKVHAHDTPFVIAFYTMGI